MIGLIFSLIAIALLIYLLYKKVNAHMSLLLSGLALLSLSLIFQNEPILNEKQALHLGYLTYFKSLILKCHQHYLV
ncbi:hypothetical protein ACFQ02_05450 [Seminibacterium arietis]|uniref:Uncharacterized protein n=1 Tax=Seminibacterium arietis TaxID=1173502 RepID=A0ABW3I8M8_9PAST